MTVDQQPTVIIPDLHGNDQKLERTVEHFGQDMRYVITGDFIDGPRTKETVELIKEMATCMGAIVLDANHEWTLKAVFDETNPVYQRHWQDDIWRRRTAEGYAGYERGTLTSYGIDVKMPNHLAAQALKETMDNLGHLEILRGAQPYLEAPDFIAVHAGLTEEPWSEEQQKSPSDDVSPYVFQKNQLDAIAKASGNPRFSSEPVQIFDTRDRVRKVPKIASNERVLTDIGNRVLVTGHSHMSIPANERITDEGKRVRLASKLRDGEPLYVYTTWDKQVVAIN